MCKASQRPRERGGYRLFHVPAPEAADVHVGDLLYRKNDILYARYMATMSVSNARENLLAAVDLSRTEAVILERYGKPAAVLVSVEQYETMMDALDDAADVLAFAAAMAEEGENIPWDQVKADLGWS